MLEMIPWRLIRYGALLAAILGAGWWTLRAINERAELRTQLAILTSDMDAERECANPSLCRQRAAETAANAAAAVLPYTQRWAEALAEARLAQRNAEAQRAYDVQQLTERLREASQRDDSCGAWLRAPVPCNADELLDGAEGREDRPAHSGDELVRLGLRSSGPAGDSDQAGEGLPGA